jgi:hypothetical protein
MRKQEVKYMIFSFISKSGYGTVLVVYVYWGTEEKKEKYKTTKIII